MVRVWSGCSRYVAEMSVSPGIDAAFTPEALITFALEQLPSMQLPDGSFCLEVRRGDDEPIGRSPRYTLMCLLGLHRAEAAGHHVPFDLATLTTRALGAPAPELVFGDFALRLWLACRGRGDVDRGLDELLARCTPELLRRAEGMQLAWTVLGTAYALNEGHLDAANLFSVAVSELIERRQMASGLMLQFGAGRRARFPNFATQIYSLLALAAVTKLELDPRSAPAAERLAAVLLHTQGADGAWPWVFDVQRGSVVEPYHLYAVHQDAMAPMAFLELSEALDDSRYRDVSVESLAWLSGQNDLGRSMLDPQQPLIYRSIRRRPPFNRIVLCANAALAYAGRAPVAGWGPLEINPTDRPYHLGWILEAWCGRT
jgi:hypothetical protein